MSFESSPSNTNPFKTNKKKSFKLRFSALHVVTKSGSEKMTRSKSLNHRKTHHASSQSQSITHSKSVHMHHHHQRHSRQSSRFMDFIHGTLDKLSLSPSQSSRSVPNYSLDLKLDLNINKPSISIARSSWKPSLEAIYRDEELLSALVTFMERSYTEESIRFVQNVHRLKDKIDEHKAEIDEIDDDIRSIFELYIAHSAEYQVNLSSDCFANTSYLCRPQSLLSSSLDTKHKLFDDAVTEIERLMVRSVLSLFYNSDEFQRLAHIKSPTQSPLTPTLTPLPIVLGMSQSTISQDDSAMVGINVKDDFEEYLDTLTTAQMSPLEPVPSPLFKSVTCTTLESVFELD